MIPRLPLFVVLCATAAAIVPPQLQGVGLCGVTQTFAAYQGRALSIQRYPNWVQTDTPPAMAYADVDVVFTPKHLDITISKNKTYYVSCRFECAASMIVPPGVVYLALNSSTKTKGSGTEFGCFPPSSTNTGSSNQPLMVLMDSMCGNGTGTGLNGSNYFELQVCMLCIMSVCCARPCRPLRQFAGVLVCLRI